VKKDLLWMNNWQVSICRFIVKIPYYMLCYFYNEKHYSLLNFHEKKKVNKKVVTNKKSRTIIRTNQIIK
jgi:hypothetical protein